MPLSKDTGDYPGHARPATNEQAELTQAAGENSGNESAGQQAQDALISRRDMLAKIPAVALGAPLAFRDSAADAAVYNTLFMRHAPSAGGTLWSWGANGYGQLGLNSTAITTTPTQVGNLSTWLSVANSGSGGWEHMLAVRADGTLWACGENGYGQLGNSASADRSSLVQVGNLSTWSQVACGSYHTVALRADGTLWSCGYNPSGELGIGLTGGKYSSPVQVGSLSSWAEVRAVGSYTIARRLDGTLWSCGNNTNGQGGRGDNVERSSLMQIGNLSTWSAVSASSSFVLALRTDGTLWSWGSGAYGKLGLGDTVSRSSPVQVGSLSSWQQISAGSVHSMAIRSDGTLWVCGYNTEGQLGLSHVASRSTLVQVGTLSTWSTIGGSNTHSWATRTDGTLWSWGDGSDYALGLGNATSRSSPVQVGSLSSWLSVTGQKSGYAILR